MSDWKKYALAAVLLTAAGVAGAENNPADSAPVRQVEWVTIPGGRFMMGTDDDISGFENAKPVREVYIRTFEMSRTPVTVEQYGECVADGRCEELDMGGNYCKWGVAGRKLDPVNCVSWNQAVQYARYKGARLPSEAEWEYAARSGGKSRKYPWGNEAAACDKAVMRGDGGPGCGGGGAMPVCSRPAGNTAQGLCDMAGNVWQWVRDVYRGSYTGAPSDGGAVEGAGAYRVARGGSFGSADGGELRADYRNAGDPASHYGDFGFRLARSGE